ncbi:hypothetical protein [Sphingobacterium paludis]|uniref:Uncharacterized protein n=1 Tax=Sphingobacterium paludis TaxID=1476465 RepID=A0A4R7CVH2_9SPHI|nr:hypothetical protein [Sphingobacterium paludis]TDS09808.1 hypothetical protein B0I21_11085 [Sphingobacterium paludis]
MNRKNIVYIALMLMLCPILTKAQNKKDTLAILENESEKQRILDYNFNESKKKDSVLILYNNKFYRLTDFDLASVVSENRPFKIINGRDSIAEIISKSVKSLIIIEDTSSSKKSK